MSAIQHLVCNSNDSNRTKTAFRDSVNFDRLEPVLENAIYRIAQESLGNACQHSKSDKVQMELIQRGRRVQFIIQDWGIGFDATIVKEECFGLAGIRERARLLGGSVQIDSQLGNGTRISIELPIELEDLAI